MLSEDYSFMLLDKKSTIIHDEYEKFITFASILRHSCRVFSYRFLYFFGLAARGACSLTGLFLFIQFAIIRLRDLVFIPVKLIKQAHEEDWLRSLAYFVRMKSLYVNNTHYGFSLRSLGNKLNVSPATLAHHLRVLYDKSLITYHGGNITFNGLRKLSAIYGPKPIGVPVDANNQLTLLRAQLIRFNLSGQKYNIKRSGVQKCQPAATPNTFSETINSCYAGLSAKGFGKVLGLSAAQGAAIRALMLRLRILSCERRYSRIFLPFGDASGGAPSGGVLRTALRQGKIQGFIPAYAFLKYGSVWVERRMELEYMRA